MKFFERTVFLKFSGAGAVDPLVGGERIQVQFIGEQRLKTRIRMLDDIERDGFNRRHDAEIPAVIVVEAPEHDPASFFPFVETVGTAPDDHPVAFVVVVEFLAVEWAFIGMVEMPGKRNQTERNILGKEIGLVPDHFKFMIVDDVDPVDIFQITAQRGAVNVLIFHHIQIKLEVMRGHFPVFPFLSR